MLANGTYQTPPAKWGKAFWATVCARCDFPTPPMPSRVTNLVVCTRRCRCAISSLRPTNAFSCWARLCRGGVSAGAAAAQARRNFLGGQRRLDAKLFLQDRATPGVLFQRGLGLSLGSQGLHQVAVRRFQPGHYGQLPAGGAGQLRPAPLLRIAQLQSGECAHYLFVQLLPDDQLPIVELDGVVQVEAGEKLTRVEIDGCRQFVDPIALDFGWQRPKVRKASLHGMNVDCGVCAVQAQGVAGNFKRRVRAEHFLEVGKFVAEVGAGCCIRHLAPEDRSQLWAEMVMIRLGGQIGQQRARLGRAKVRDRPVVERDRKAAEQFDVQCIHGDAPMRK